MNNLINQLKRHEGLKLRPYKCTAGKLTIGYGRNIEDNGITEKEAELLLMHDIEAVKHELRKFDWYINLTQIRQEVIVNMAFNIGVPRLLGFKRMIAAIKGANFELAAAEMLDSKWAKQVKSRSLELARQMRTGTYSRG